MNTILVVADLVEQAPIAIRQACQMARLYDARLHIVHYCYVDLERIDGDNEEIRQRIIDNQRQQSEQVIKNCVEEGIEYTHSVEWCKHIYKWVCDYADLNRPIMVVKTGHRTETMFYTPTDWHLIRQCPAPVLIAAEKKWRKVENVMAAVDLESRSDAKQALNTKILDVARKMAEFFEVEMHVCYSPPAPPVLRDLGLRFPDEVESKAKAALKDSLEEIKREYHLDDSRIHIHAGQAEKVIPSMAAKYNVSLVVVGTSAQGGLKSRLLGNVAEKILALLKTDVLTIKPD